MTKNFSLRLAILACSTLIVLPVSSSVKNLFSNRTATAQDAALSGNPLPMPTPPGRVVLSVSGNPLPMPTPPGRIVLSASGNPLPMPTPPGFAALSISGNPLPMPTPPRSLA
ncbi:MAG TPA: hypothetical protein VMI32_16915 [Candidatus Solibacter sp.]|nr:hypothetical protein [Candidatus Solibacter sp.]